MSNTITVTSTSNSISVTNTPNQITVYDGAEPGPSYVTPSYSNQYGSGDRQAVLSGCMRVPSSIGSGVSSGAQTGQYFNGAYTNFGYADNGANLSTSDRILFNFTGLASVTFKITEMTIYFDTTMNCGVWRPMELRDNEWVAIGANFTLGSSATQAIDCSSSTGAAFFCWEAVSGTTSYDANWREIEFKIGAEA
jgi:hypothetical protein